MLNTKRETMPRDADQTRKRILAAATAEFARKGLGGARVDEIAARSKANKRMIYHYFGSKEQLFTAVLEDAYLGIRSAEQTLQEEQLTQGREGEYEARLETLGAEMPVASTGCEWVHTCFFPVMPMP